MNKVLLGCGMVFALVAGALILGGVYAAKWFREEIPHRQMKVMHDRRTELIEVHGRDTKFVPPLDGAYDPARVEIYLDVRDVLGARRADLAADIEELVAWTVENPDAGVLQSAGKMGSVAEIYSSLALSASAGDSILLAREMPLGEYLHYHTALLWGWIDSDSLRREMDATLQAMHSEEGTGLDEVFEERRNDAEEAAGTLLRAHLRNLVRATQARPSDDATAYLALIRSGDPNYPFTDPLPPSLRQAFEAHAARIRSSAPNSLGTWLAEMATFFDIESNRDRAGS